MITERLKALISLGVLMGAIGLILLFFSVHFGTLLADIWLTN